MALERVDGGLVEGGAAGCEILRTWCARTEVAIVAYRADGSLLLANRAMIELAGHSVDAFAGPDWLRAIYPDDDERARTDTIIADLIARGAPRQHQRTLTRGDGTQRFVHILSTPIELAEGGGAAVVSQLFDLTALPEPMRFPRAHGLRGLVEDATESLVRIDVRTGRFLYVSRTVERMLGFTPDELYADPDLPRRQVLPEHRAAFDEALRDASAGTPHWTVLGLRRRDGGVVTVHLALYPIVDATGAAVVVECVARDITAMRSLERQLETTVEELEQRNQELASLDRLKSSLLANVSHELRTPLVSIKGYNELLLRGALGPLTERQRRGLEIARTNTERLIELIETLLDFHRREEGALVVRRTRIDVRRAVCDAAAAYVERMRARGIELAVNLGDKPLEVEGDHARLVQVFGALLSNAEKFSEGPSTVELRAHVSAGSADGGDGAAGVGADGDGAAAERADGDGAAAERADGDGADGAHLASARGEVRISVVDQGIGVPPAQRQKIFERFYQADAGPTRRHGGAGLGLALAREIVTLHGGRVELESGPPRGATFTVVLPLARAEVSSVESARPVVLVGARGDRWAAIERHLARWGFAALDATTVPDLLRRARRHRPDALVLALPIDETAEALRHLSRDDATRDLPAVAVVAPGERSRALALADVALDDDDDGLAELPARLRQLLAPDARPDGAPHRIMVVDDDLAAVDFMRFVLEREGCEVAAFVSGEQALEHLDGAYDLCILDVVIHGVDGLELCRRVRRSSHGAHRVPVLMITAHTDDQLRLDCFAAGADGFLVKPFGVDDFLRQVRLHVRPPAKTLDTPTGRV